MRVRWDDCGVVLNNDGLKGKLPQSLYEGDNVLLAEPKAELDRIVGYFENVHRRRILKVNLSK